jgi:HK97 family phage major capsid protein
MRKSLLDDAPGQTRGRQEPAAQGPSLTEIVGAVIEQATGFDTGRRNALVRALTHAGVPAQQTDGVVDHFLPASLTRSILPATFPTTRAQPDEFTRTGTTFNGTDLGFTVKPGFADDVADRQRTTFGPSNLVQWWDVDTRMYSFPTVQETSRITGQRWGGMTSTWGLGELNLPPQVDGKVAMCDFVNQRLLILTTLSRDLWEDAKKLERWLNYVALAEIRFNIEAAILMGITGCNRPMSVVNSPCTVTITPESGQTAGTIEAVNLDKMWGAIAPGSKRNACWFASGSAMKAIDQLAVSGQWPEINYIPAGRYGNAYPTIKGKPLLYSECLPVIGTPGDIICADLSDYVFTYMKAPAGGISISVDVSPGFGRTGMVGLPERALERRASADVLFSTDQIALIFKFRGDGRFLWNSQVTLLNGDIVGPAAIIGQR